MAGVSRMVMPGDGESSAVDLPRVRAALAVVAHPDDESFGLGAVLAALAGAGAVVGVLCFTDGGASTLGTHGGPLGARRARELEEAAAALRIGPVVLLDYPDGHLAEAPLAELADHVDRQAAAVGAELLVVFDEGGITGHPDHEQASRAALAASGGLPVLAWAVEAGVARALNAELGTGFVGRGEAEVDLRLRLGRSRQRAAIACHESQSGDNAVLWRRLELQGAGEVLRWLRRPGADPRRSGP